MNNNFGVYEKSFQLILDTIKAYAEIEKAIIFGSRAMGNYRKGSDIDIAIIGENITDQIKTRVSSVLNQELPIPYFIDIIDYKEIANVNLLKHIDADGKLIFARKREKENKTNI